MLPLSTVEPFITNPIPSPRKLSLKLSTTLCEGSGATQ